MECESTPTNRLVCTEEPVTIAPHRSIKQGIAAVDRLFQLVNKIRRTVFPDDQFCGFEFICVVNCSSTYQGIEFPEDTRNPSVNVPGLVLLPSSPEHRFKPEPMQT